MDRRKAERKRKYAEKVRGALTTLSRRPGGAAVSVQKSVALGLQMRLCSP